MFYIQGKDRLKAITEDNVFTFCPRCNKEFNVNLSIFLKQGTLQDEIFCRKCSKDLGY